MPQRIPNQLKFRLERLTLRGPQYRLLIIAALIGLLLLLGGSTIHLFDTNFRGRLRRRGLVVVPATVGPWLSRR